MVGRNRGASMGRRGLTSIFQGLFPHGIQVLGNTDFFMVSVRRSAFLEAAPKVAQ